MVLRIFLWVCLLVISIDASAQLSSSQINDIAQANVDKWATYLNLSNSRKSQLKKKWIAHEQRKERITRNLSQIESSLGKENEQFINELSMIFTPNELELYKTIDESNNMDDRETLASLVEAISTDTLFIHALADLQYDEILPSRLRIRMELEDDLSFTDKIAFDSIRGEIHDAYDVCLITCINNKEHDHSVFQNFDDQMMVAVNKSLSNENSGLNRLLKLTKKYEENIHKLYIKHLDQINYWNKRVKELEQ